MKQEPDADLRAHFQSLRQTDRENAPAWNPKVIETPLPRQHAALFRVLILPACAAAALAVGLVVMTFPQDNQPRLSDVLPVLFDSSGEPLFAAVESPQSSLSDFLLPPHLTIQMP